MDSSNGFIATSADWLAVLPEAILACFGVLLILAGAFKKFPPIACRMLAYLGFAASLAALAFAGKESAFFETLSSRAECTALFVFCGILSVSMSARYLESLATKNAGEFFGILMFAAAALSIFSRSQHLMLTFVALEASAICFYALIAWGRRTVENLEASIRYIIASGVSGAFLLLGIAFIYGASFDIGSDMLYFGNFTEGAGSALFGVGAVLAISAVFFKLSAFPFQFWSADVYQGSPLPVGAFLAVASKSAAVFVLYKMLISLPYSSSLVNILSLSAALSIIVGNFGGIAERNPKRIIAFSGIANAGYLLVFLTSAVVLLNLGAENANMISLTLVFYVLAYAFALYSVFFTQSLNYSESDYNMDICAYNGLSQKNPLATVSLTVALASLAGIPPTAGFFAKLLVLVLAYAAGLYWLMLVLILGSAASIYYYFKWIRASCEPAKEGAVCGFGRGYASILLALTLAILILGVKYALYLC
ncbi:MAG: NADH-quinone oxidoreductase subunit N [Opitutales bacterium]|nr:NADH-quinone oxidoreductase subunit N [Opitutales bacterium]